MATIKLKKAVNVEDIYCRVTCPQCEKTVNMRLKGSLTRKNCPKCNKITFHFTLKVQPGWLNVSVQTEDVYTRKQEYELSSEDVEIDNHE